MLIAVSSELINLLLDVNCPVVRGNVTFSYLVIKYKTAN